MSKLSQRIDDVLTGQYRASRLPPPRYTDIKFHTSAMQHEYGTDKEVMLSVQLRTKAWINERTWNDTEIRSQAIRDLKRSMIEEIFGEFRPIIIELHSSIYDVDVNRTRTLLAELEHQMFTDGL